jgi:hypothetical protein
MKIGAFVILALIISLGSSAQVTYDASSINDMSVSSNSSSTMVHTVGNYSNRIMIIAVCSSNYGTASVTVGGGAATLIYECDKDGTSLPGSSVYTSLWYRVAPPVGQTTVVVTVTNTPGTFHTCVSTYYGVNQNFPIDVSGMGAVAGPSTNYNFPGGIPDYLGDMVVDALGASASTGVSAAAAGQTGRSSFLSASRTLGTSDAPGAALTTMQWNGTYTNLSYVFASLAWDAILPIRLDQFSAHCLSSHAAEIKWCTLSETNNAYFTLERAGEDGNFSEIVRIAGAGNSSAPLHYSYTDDQKPQQNILYYRLRQTDFNGQTTVSAPVAVSCKLGESGIRLYPNPAVKELNYDLYANQAEQVTFQEFDFSGREVSSETLELTEGFNHLVKDVSHLAPGVYLLRMKSAESCIQERFCKVE